MEAEVRYPFLEEIQKKSLRAITGIIGISFMIGGFFGMFLWFSTVIIKIIFPYWPVSIVFLTITGIFLIFLEIARYKNYRLLDWIPVSILINAFIAGTTLPMLFAGITTENYQIFFAFFPILSLFMFWNFGKAMLDGLIEMKKITLEKNKQHIINIVSWLFYFFIVFLNLV